MSDPALPPAPDPASSHAARSSASASAPSAAPSKPDPPALVRPPLSPLEALGLLALGLVGTALARALGTNPSTIGGAVGPALVVLSWIGPVWWLVSRRGQDPLVALALVPPRALVLATTVSITLLVLFVAALLGPAAGLVRAPGPLQPILPALRAAIATSAWHVAFVALPEETFFRGALLPVLQRDDARGVDVLGARLGGAVLVQALLFGAAHVLLDAVAGQPPTALRALTVFPAVWFAWLRLRTGSVLPGVVAHAASNGVLLACAQIGLLG